MNPVTAVVVLTGKRVHYSRIPADAQPGAGISAYSTLCGRPVSGRSQPVPDSAICRTCARKAWRQ